MNSPSSDAIHAHHNYAQVGATGFAHEDVQRALALYQAVTQLQLDARSDLAEQAQRVMAAQAIPLISEASKRQVERSAALKLRLIEQYGVETYGSLASLRGISEASARSWVSHYLTGNSMFTVEIDGETFIPKTLLTSTGDLNPVVTELVRPLKREGLDGWSIWAWLTHPTGLLSSEVPLDVAIANMPRAHTAASRYADELASAHTSVA